MPGREAPVNPDNFTTAMRYFAEGEVLDIGSGDAHPHADVTVDADPAVEPDVLADLTEGIPFEDDEYANVTGFHIIEHLPDDLFLWEEMQRVASERAVAIVPIGPRDDPDHEHLYETIPDAVERFDPDETDTSSMAGYVDLVMVKHV